MAIICMVCRGDCVGFLRMYRGVVGVFDMVGARGG